jgi:hypothetical protein
MSGAIMETFKKYGLDWEQVAQHMHLGSKEACLLAFSSIGLASTPFDQSAMSLPDKALLPATSEGMRFRGSGDAVLRRNMSSISASIGVEAAAAGAEASIAEHRGRVEAILPQGINVEVSETATRVMQEAGCKGALLSAVAARSKVLAHREVCLPPSLMYHVYDCFFHVSLSVHPPPLSVHPPPLSVLRGFVPGDLCRAHLQAPLRTPPMAPALHPTEKLLHKHLPHPFNPLLTTRKITPTHNLVPEDNAWCASLQENHGDVCL